MRVLYLDIDTLRPDHLGCYGYHRATSPNIDRLAAGGVRFDNCYVSDAPCLPSRAAMFTGQFGIHTGVVNHGGLAADIRPVGRYRRFETARQRPGFIECLRHAGLHAVSVSPFAERHSAWWFCAGWNEMYNTGSRGMESAEQVTPAALDWLARHAREDNWLLHVNYWDPHTPFRAPPEFGEPFADQPPPAWYTEELRRRHWDSFGPHSAQEPMGNFGRPNSDRWPRMPDRIASLGDYKRWIDGYDTGIRYADEHCGRILSALADAGVLDDTLVIVTSDHGENQGELGIYGDHQTADHVTSRVPMILRLPSGGTGFQPVQVAPGGTGFQPVQVAGPRVDDALHYQSDVAATLVELLGEPVPEHWDGRSFADAFRAGQARGRDYLVLSQMAWSCQRAVRWGDHVFIRTWHTGLKDLPERMLFDVRRDGHELNDLADARTALADHGQALLEKWTSDMLARGDGADPLWTVMAEGGPYHDRECRSAYLEHLRRTGRAHHADFLAACPTGLSTQRP